MNNLALVLSPEVRGSGRCNPRLSTKLSNSVKVSGVSIPPTFGVASGTRRLGKPQEYSLWPPSPNLACVLLYKLNVAEASRTSHVYFIVNDNIEELQMIEELSRISEVRRVINAATLAGTRRHSPAKIGARAPVPRSLQHIS